LFHGVPNFAPEILRRVRLEDPMKAKKLKDALVQLGEEGVVQLFLPEDGSPAIVGVIGALQLDVLKERLSNEYGLPVSFEPSRFNVCRWMAPKEGSGDKADVAKFIETHRGDIARDLDGDAVFMAANGFMLNYEAERAPKITFQTLKDYQVRRGG
jgi:peptide chain release factor 3